MDRLTDRLDMTIIVLTYDLPKIFCAFGTADLTYSIPVHRYSAVHFVFSSPLGLLGSEICKQNTA